MLGIGFLWACSSTKLPAGDLANKHLTTPDTVQAEPEAEPLMWVGKDRAHSFTQEMTKQSDTRIRIVLTVPKYILGAREEQVALERLTECSGH